MIKKIEKQIFELLKDNIPELEYFNQLRVYKEGFNVLMEYWDSLPDEEKTSISKRLDKLGL